MPLCMTNSERGTAERGTCKSRCHPEGMALQALRAKPKARGSPLGLASPNEPARYSACGSPERRQNPHPRDDRLSYMNLTTPKTLHWRSATALFFKLTATTQCAN